MGPFVRVKRCTYFKEILLLVHFQLCCRKQWKHSLPQRTVKEIKYDIKYHTTVWYLLVCTLRLHILPSVLIIWLIFCLYSMRKMLSKKLTPGNSWHSFLANFVPSLAERAHSAPLRKECLQQGRGSISISESPAALYSPIFIKTRPCLLVLLPSGSGSFL